MHYVDIFGNKKPVILYDFSGDIYSSLNFKNKCLGLIYVSRYNCHFHLAVNTFNYFFSNF